MQRCFQRELLIVIWWQQQLRLIYAEVGNAEINKAAAAATMMIMAAIVTPELLKK